MKVPNAIMLVALFAAIWIPAESLLSQSLPYAPDPSLNVTVTGPVLPTQPYTRPTQKTQFNNFLFDAFGPYPIVASAAAAGLNQFTNSPPEWNQGMKGYGRRFGSDLGISAVGTTTRYALAEALHEDTLYYRCECRGVFPRAGHALLSTLTARRGVDGHRIFSFAALVAPYAGSMTAVYAWYPDRFGPKDAFRIGNYNLLAYAGGNVALEFFYSGPHSLLSRMHLNNSHGAPEPGPNH